jgi:subtilase family serine protease
MSRHTSRDNQTGRSAIRPVHRFLSARILTVGAVLAVMLSVITTSWSPVISKQLEDQTAGSGGSPSLLALFDTSGPVKGDQFLGPLSPDQPVVLVVGLKYQDTDAMMRFLSAVENPGSPDYRHYLTSAEFDREFAPSVAAVDDVKDYFAAKGAVSVTPSSDGLLLTVVMNASSIGGAFGTGLGWFRGIGSTYYNAVAAPSLPPQIESEISGISGLTNEGNAYLSMTAEKIAQGSFSLGYGGTTEFDKVSNSNQSIYWGTDYQAIYGELPLLNKSTNGSGYAVDTILLSGWNNTANGGKGENLPPFDPEALKLYYQASFPRNSTLPQPIGVPVTVPGEVGNVTPPLPGSPPLLGGVPMTDDSGSVVENSLDLEMAASMAPGAQLYNFYFGASLLTQSLDSVNSNFDTALDAALSYDYGNNKLAAISNSWGLTDSIDTVWDSLEQKAAAMGVTLLASSGDQGNAPTSLQDHPQGQWPSFPATATFDTYGVVAVGGTFVNVSGIPTGTWDPRGTAAPPSGYDAGNISGIASEEAWFSPSSDPAYYSGTEGGISLYVNEPLWQAHSAAQSAIEYAAGQENVHYARGVPDIAASAYNTIVFYSETSGAVNGVGVELVGGTSVSSPLMAGMVAMIDEANNVQLGFLDPEIYNISSYFAVNPGPLNPFADIVDGHNYVFNASKGWDALTGWGSPSAMLLAQDLTNRTYTTFVYNPLAVPGNASGPPSNIQTGSSMELTYYLIAVASVLMVASISIYAAQRLSSSRSQPRLTPPSSSSSGGTAAQAGRGEVAICKSCGREFDKGWGFCPHCGSYPDK